MNDFSEHSFGPVFKGRNLSVHLKMEPIVSAESSARDCHFSLRYSPEERSYRLD